MTEAPIKILSIDGGGIRGLIPAIILEHIEEKTGKPISELFDLIVGTSTGGILALGLTVPDKTGEVAKNTATQLKEIYQKDGKKIFDKSFVRKIPGVNFFVDAILDDEIYDHAGLEEVLCDHLNSTVMEQAVTKVMLTAYDMKCRESVFFKSWKEKHKKLSMLDCARATSAAPTYFEPKHMEIDNKKGKGRRTLIDGGIFMNNPAMSGYVEALKLKRPDQDIVVVSLGTGMHTRSYDYADVKNWNKISWLKPMLSCIFDGASDAVDYQLNRVLGKKYFRFQTELSKGYDDLDNATETNLGALEIKANEIINENCTELQDLIEIL